MVHDVHAVHGTHDVQMFRILDMICSRVHRPDELPGGMENNLILEMSFKLEFMHKPSQDKTTAQLLEAVI